MYELSRKMRSFAAAWLYPNLHLLYFSIVSWFCSIHSLSIFIISINRQIVFCIIPMQVRCPPIGISNKISHRNHLQYYTTLHSIHAKLLPIASTFKDFIYSPLIIKIFNNQILHYFALYIILIDFLKMSIPSFLNLFYQTIP